MRRPWWTGGVRFACQASCGRCCDEPGGIVYLSPADAERIADHEGMPVPEWLARDARTTHDGRYVLKSRDSDGVCIHLNSTKQCDIYSVRPQQCKAFPWWSENLATQRSWEDTKERCPGIEAEDALLIDGATVRLHMFADRVSTKGFRVWPPKRSFWNR